MRFALVVVVFAATAASCGPTVDCQALCARTLACQVTFDAPDDPEAELVESGERTPLESCTLGCDASPIVTVDRALCVDAIEIRDVAACQQETRACLDVDE